ncbi:AI-2E family transporter [Acidipropionibacterium jensenii]|uniref:AI-2E family transporter n=1 Tax=Acidipropionibacterium jensenii TaxID=1749 RepID=A0A3Q9UL84_9ACTN|nr:AI-2E family transporter [Acidipropionibacterium jensenii]AZZ39958.1 AI-2E family transporter [Acidipropionibacterium jensenii]
MTAPGESTPDSESNSPGSGNKPPAATSSPQTVASPAADSAAAGPTVARADGSADHRDPVPSGLRAAAGWSWRILVIGALVYMVAKVLATISDVTIPIAVALMLTAALWSLAHWFIRHGLHRGLSAALCLLLLVIVVGGLFTLVGAQIASQWGELSNQTMASFAQLTHWLDTGPLHIGSDQLNNLVNQGEAWAKASQGRIAGWAAAAGTGVGHFVAGLLIALFATFFFLYEGSYFGETLSHLVPRSGRSRILDAAKRGWVALVAYVRAAVIVAFVDGLGAGIGAALIGSSVAVAIGALTFVLAFVPIAGALIAGVVAVAVVLVTLGWVKAIIMLIVFVAVMEIEGHVLQPFLLGKAVSIHPLAVLLGIAIGASQAGIVGALFAIPLVAFGFAFAKALSSSASPEEAVPVDDEPRGSRARTA